MEINENIDVLCTYGDLCEGKAGYNNICEHRDLECKYSEIDCNHKNIESIDGCNTCLDCGISNWK